MKPVPASNRPCRRKAYTGVIVMLLPILISLLITCCFYPFPDLTLDVGI